MAVLEKCAARILPDAFEESTYIITAVFTDRLGNAVIPNAITWTLSYADGGIVNSREDIVIAAPAASVDVVLQGADLALLANDTGERFFTTEADYDSDAGNGLPLNGECKFQICAAVNIP